MTSRAVINALLLAAFLAGVCASADDLEPPTTSLVCTDPERSHEITRTTDPEFFRGRLSLVDDQFEFRTCDTENVYVLDASFEIEDQLREFVATLSAGEAKPAFVRFTGYKLECDGPLPAGLAGVIKVKQLQAHSSSIPVNCN